MAKNEPFLITKPEVKFWLAILGLVVGGAIAFNTLKMEVKAMNEKGIQLRKEYESTEELFQEWNDRLIRMETNQEHIMRALNIEIDDLYEK